MPIKLNTASGGGVILTGANTATDKTITVPADDGTMIYANSSGNVGIGTSSPSYQLHTVGNTNGNVTNGVTNSNSGTDAAARFIAIADAGSAVFGMTSSGYTGITGAQDAMLLNAGNASGGIAFALDGVLKAKINSSGKLFVNTTDLIGPGMINIKSTVSGEAAIGCQNTAGAGSYFLWFVNAANNAVIGSISNNGNTATAFNTSSDYRLKHDIQPMQDALAKVAALKPCTYRWNANDSEGEGFIAHELAEVCPGAVTGEKDAVNEDGSIKPQGIDTSFLVATLTAAIQELKAELDITKAKVAALEAK